MGTGVQFVGLLAATPVAYGIYQALGLVYRELTSPLRDLPGPKSSSLIYGNFKEMIDEEDSEPQERWVREHGPTIRYKGFFGVNHLYTTDTKALNHVLTNTNDYQKPEHTRYALSRILGAGVLIVEGDKHKLQRKVMNPAFGPSQIRELTEIFVEKSIQLRDIWAAESSKQGGTGRIDVLSWLSRMTLDVIGQAGFNYNFEALDDDPKRNELNNAFATMLKAGTEVTVFAIIKALVPLFRSLSGEHDTEIKQSQETMSRIGNQLLRESKASIHEKSAWKARDLFSLLVKANMGTDVPESQRMSDQDVLAQVPTFLVAGHETTSNGTTWALYALTQDVRVQTKLRDELLTVDTDNPTMDELNALPYLDMVVRETLRVHAPVSATVRTAMKDDILPLNIPFTDSKGRVHYEVRIKKGQTLEVPIVAVNRARTIWGEDAGDFRPERWESVPEGASSVPGIWGNMMTFLGGPRACIGYRFALVEMKALLFTLVRAFEFELAIPPTDITKKSSIVIRPVLPDKSNQMPLLIKSFRPT